MLAKQAAAPRPAALAHAVSEDEWAKTLKVIKRKGMLGKFDGELVEVTPAG